MTGGITVVITGAACGCRLKDVATTGGPTNDVCIGTGVTIGGGTTIGGMGPGPAPYGCSGIPIQGSWCSPKYSSSMKRSCSLSCLSYPSPLTARLLFDPPLNFLKSVKL